jgi:hypothetical protein
MSPRRFSGERKIAAAFRLQRWKNGSDTSNCTKPNPWMMPLTTCKRIDQIELSHRSEEFLREHRNYDGGQCHSQFMSRVTVRLSKPRFLEGKPVTYCHSIVTDRNVIGQFLRATSRFEATAAPVSGEKRDQIWASQVRRLPGIAAYQKKTTRKIPVVELVRCNGS